MRAVEVVRHVVINGRKIESFSVSDKALESLGIKSVTRIRDLFMDRIIKQGIGVPMDMDGNEVDLLGQSKIVAFYTFEMRLDFNEYYILSSVSISPVTIGQRKYDGFVFCVEDADVKIGGVK